MRSPLGALLNVSPVPLVERTARYNTGSVFTSPRADGFVGQMDAYSTVGTVFAIVDRLVTAVSRVDWELWRKAPSGLKEDRVKVTSHAAIDLWEKPNPHMGRAQFLQYFQQHKELTGEGNAVVGRVPGIKLPIELWPVRPDRLIPVPDPFTFLAGWVYRSPDGEKVPLELNELMRSIKPSPLDPYRGQGPIQALMTDLDAARYAREYERNFYLNSAEPGGVIEIDRRLDDDEFTEMRERWAEQHKGVSKAHRVALIEMGAKWVDRKITHREMQFAERMNFHRDVILEAWGFPRAALGITQDVNRANAEAGEYFFGKWLIETRCDDIKDMLNTQLLPMYGKDVPKQLEWDYVSPVPENLDADMKALTARSTAAVSLVGARFDPAEVLEAVGLPAMERSEPEPAPVLPPVPGQDGPPKALPADAYDWGTPIENAMRWVVEAHSDGSVCEPCKENDGKTYRNRQDAYEDYPNGSGYVRCVGAQYGNSCRCKVIKRRKKT